MCCYSTYGWQTDEQDNWRILKPLILPLNIVQEVSQNQGWTRMVPTALLADLELTKPKIEVLGLQTTVTSCCQHKWMVIWPHRPL